MPERANQIVLGLAGVLAVAGLVLVGANLHRAARRGPQWKRRLIAAGLLLLSSLGLGVGACSSPPGPSCYTPQPPPEVQKNEATLDALARRLDELKKLTTAAQQPKEVYAAEVQAHIDLAEHELKTLAAEMAAGTWPEWQRTRAAQLRQQIEQEIAALRPSNEDFDPADCYAIMYVPLLPSPVDSKQRLAAQQMLIDKLVAADRLAPEVLERMRAGLVRETRETKDASES